MKWEYRKTKHNSWWEWVDMEENIVATVYKEDGCWHSTVEHWDDGICDFHYLGEADTHREAMEHVEAWLEE